VPQEVDSPGARPVLAGPIQGRDLHRRHLGAALGTLLLGGGGPSGHDRACGYVEIQPHGMDIAPGSHPHEQGPR
jgi:hypothetical protein